MSNFLKVYDFKSYNEAKRVFEELKLSHKFSTENDQDTYSLIIGPVNNIEANNLVLSFRAFTSFIVNTVIILIKKLNNITPDCLSIIFSVKNVIE